jgi:hypothetical protein
MSAGDDILCEMMRVSDAMQRRAVGALVHC